MDYISREDAINALKKVSEHYTEYGREWHPHIDFVIDAIRELRPADVVEQRTGKWETEICDDGYGAYNLYKCDQCGDLSAQPRNYCRECGARMVSDEVYSNI